MGALIDVLERSSGAAPADVMETLLLCALLGLVLGQLIAWAYVLTHTGLSYSRSFTQSLVLLTLVVSLVMLVIGNNIITAFGLIGALAIIRFRNVLKDTKDMVFVFLSLVVGMAIGSGKYLTAGVGTITIIIVMLYLHVTSFGTKSKIDGHVSFVVSHGGGDDDCYAGAFRRFCRVFKVVSVRQTGTAGVSEYVIEVRLRDLDRSRELVDSLMGIPEVTNVALVMNNKLSEV
ncbi:MAG: DUF4956 domain-containing protein [Proteobacteria bacterium]|nr:DUF4956 domain-containing protein [Pseudomonadota bacterium]